MNILDQTDRTILCNSVSEMAASLDGADFAATMTAIAEQELIGALVSEAAGGMDLDLVSVAAIAATLARFHLRENFVDAILAAQVAELIEPEVCAALLNGKKTATVASAGSLFLASGKMSGGLGHVALAGDADILLACVETEAGQGLALIDLSADGIEISRMAGLDLERPSYRVTARAAPVIGEARGEAMATYRRASAVITAAWLQATAGYCLAEAVEHVSTRSQFGRPLVALPVLRDTLAGLQLKLENARLLVDDALVRPEAAAAETALAYAMSVCPQIAEKSLHLFGGMGYTWEVPLHFYLRRLRDVVDTAPAARSSDVLAPLVGEVA